MAHKTSLDKSLVVQAAAEILNLEGSEALTLKRLADRLQIQSPSLYNHIDGMPGLVNALAALNLTQLAEQLGSAAIGRSGKPGLFAVAQQYRAYIKENPGLYMFSLRASRNQELPNNDLQASEDKVVKIVLTMLDSIGLTGNDAIHATRGLRSAIHGFTTLEIVGGFGLPLEIDESFKRLINNLLDGFSASISIHPR